MTKATPPARRTSTRFRDDRAEMGMSTMIVFVSLVLVAATASSVLVNAAVKLQEKSQRTGNEVADQISNNIQIISIEGRRPGSTGELTGLNITIGLAAGTTKMDLSQMKVQLKFGDIVQNLGYNETAPGANGFTTSEIRDEDASHNNTAPVMNTGDIVILNTDLSAAGHTLGPRESMGFVLFPELGTPIRVELTSPPTFGSDQVVRIR